MTHIDIEKIIRDMSFERKKIMIEQLIAELILMCLVGIYHAASATFSFSLLIPILLGTFSVKKYISERKTIVQHIKAGRIRVLKTFVMGKSTYPNGEYDSIYYLKFADEDADIIQNECTKNAYLITNQYDEFYVITVGNKKVHYSVPVHTLCQDLKKILCVVPTPSPIPKIPIYGYGLEKFNL